MNLFERLVIGDVRGIHYAVSIFIATTILWILVKEVADANPIWAISSMVATRRDGKWVYYRIASEDALAILGTLHQIYCA